MVICQTTVSAAVDFTSRPYRRLHSQGGQEVWRPTREEVGRCIFVLLFYCTVAPRNTGREGTNKFYVIGGFSLMPIYRVFPLNCRILFGSYT